MRNRLLVSGSLALNLFLVVVLLAGRQRSERQSQRDPSDAREVTSTATDTPETVADGADSGTASGMTEAVSWDELDSLDFKELIARLREAGYPEDTVRDIVIGRVGRALEVERLNSIEDADLNFWQSDADERLKELAERTGEELDRKREKLLADLLGAGWNAGRTGASESAPFYGAILTAMPEGKAGIVRAIEAQYAAKVAEAIRDGGQTDDPATVRTLAQLRKAKRNALEAALTSREFEAYQLRYSSLARNMRSELANFNATSNEFRSIFMSRDPVEWEMAMDHQGRDDGSVQKRKDLERKAADEIRRALGDVRFQEYQFNLDPVYRSARDFAAKVGEEGGKAMSLYEIGGWARLERQRIEKDASMDELTRRSALAETRRRLDQFLVQILSPAARQKSRELELDFLDSLPR